MCGWVAGMAFGLDATFWSRAVSPDPWPLTVLLFAIMSSFLLKWSFLPRHRRYLYAAMLVYGLGLTNSESLLIPAPGLGLLILFADRELGRDIFAAATIFLIMLVGAGIFRIMPSPSLLDRPDIKEHWFVYLGTLSVCALIKLTCMTLITRNLFSNWKALLFVALCFSKLACLRCCLW